MRKIFTILVILMLAAEGKAQTTDSITSIDNLFVGIPVKEGFKKWVEYLYKNPHMGLDSANIRGTYSSLKPGMKSHFPFPDSVNVKILAGNLLRRIPGIDTLFVENELLIEGIFGDSENARKNAVKFYDQLEKLLKKYYKIRTEGFDRMYYSKGVNKNFPPCDMSIGYSKELKFYYVMLHYEEPVE